MRVDPLDHRGPTGAVGIVLQVALDGAHHCPTILEMCSQYGVDHGARAHSSHVLLGTHAGSDCAVTREAASTHHAPERFVCDNRARRVSECMRQAVMLMIRAHHDVSAVERVPLWVVITECVVGREHIP